MTASPRRSTDDWEYRRIYVGQVAGGLEHLIRTLLPRLTAELALERWFFLRFVDEDGAHLRLRLLPARGTRVEPRLEQLVGEALQALPHFDPPRYVPLIPVRHGPRAGSAEVLRSVSDKYVPEVQSFGEEGIEVAEALFQASSEVAVRILVDEHRGGMLRKTLAPVVMAATGAAFLPEDLRRLWSGYADYWLSTQTWRADDWRARFVAKAAELRDAGVSLLPSDEALGPTASALRRYWREATDQAARRYAELGEQTRDDRSNLAYHFLHLTNNRLGITPLEEAYFATLLACDGEETSP